MATDGPGTFSCVGLMRYILRTTGVDPEAPWVPEEYLSRYTLVDSANLQPGDIVIYPGWATMYVGNGMLLNANELTRSVTHTPLTVAGVLLGAVRPPYSGVPTNPSPTDPQATSGDPLAAPAGQLQYDTSTGPLAPQRLLADPLAQSLPAEPLAQPLNELNDPTIAADTATANPALAADPTMASSDPLATEVVDPLATEVVEPMTTEAIEPY